MQVQHDAAARISGKGALLHLAALIRTVAGTSVKANCRGRVTRPDSAMLGCVSSCARRLCKRKYQYASVIAFKKGSQRKRLQHAPRPTMAEVRQMVIWRMQIAVLGGLHMQLCQAPARRICKHLYKHAW